MIDTRKEDFIDDYFQAALESSHDIRTPHQIRVDAKADWEADQIDLAYERYLQDHTHA